MNRGAPGVGTRGLVLGSKLLSTQQLDLGFTQSQAETSLDASPKNLLEQSQLFQVCCFGFLDDSNTCISYLIIIKRAAELVSISEVGHHKHPKNLGRGGLELESLEIISDNLIDNRYCDLFGLVLGVVYQ